ncbi:MAG TPA: hypothetical protein VG890_13915 [Puia sp.]|nr:hypothetical protein [Puia sp.]
MDSNLEKDLPESSDQPENSISEREQLELKKLHLEIIQLEEFGDNRRKERIISIISKIAVPVIVSASTIIILFTTNFFSAQRAELNATVLNLKRDIADFSDKKDLLHKHNDSLIIERSALLQKISVSKIEISKLTKDLATLNLDKEKLSSTIRKLSLERDSLRFEIRIAKRSIGMLGNQLRDQINEDLPDTVLYLKAQNDSLRRVILQLQKNN